MCRQGKDILGFDAEKRGSGSRQEGVLKKGSKREAWTTVSDHWEAEGWCRQSLMSGGRARARPREEGPRWEYALTGAWSE